MLMLPYWPAVVAALLLSGKLSAKELLPWAIVLANTYGKAFHSLAPDPDSRQLLHDLPGARDTEGNSARMCRIRSLTPLHMRQSLDCEVSSQAHHLL